MDEPKEQGDAQQELAALRDEQRALREALARLDQRLSGAELRPPPAAPTPEATPDLPAVPPLTPPPLPPLPPPASSTTVQELPPPLPPLPRPTPPPTMAVPPPLPAQAFAPPPVPVPPSPNFAQLPPPAPGAVPAAASATTSSLEQRIGEVWLVRVGIVALLTGLVLLAGYLYQHVILGPLAKVVLLYLGAGALTGAGAFLERRASAQEGGANLQNYARVLLGGGLAAVYYVTYAAHYLPGLKVIGNPWLAGTLLLGWTAFMAWLADRRDSQTLATFALLLAYYTSAVSEVSGFTLFSNLALTAAAVFLLRRHGWSVFSFASLLATYGSYGFWKFYGAIHGPVLDAVTEPRPALQPERFWLECTFLALYWALFTAAAFFQPAASSSTPTAGQALPPRRKATFVSLNHGLLFALVSVWVQAVYPGQFWKWSFGFGLTLFALSEARRLTAGRLVPDNATAGASRLLGIVFFTSGLLGYFTGWQLALALAAETVVLTLAAGTSASTWERRLMLGLASMAGMLAAVIATGRLFMAHAHAPDGQVSATGAAVGAALIFAAFWCARMRRDPGATPVMAEAGVRFAEAWLALLGAGTWLAAIGSQVTEPTARVVAIAGAAVVLTLAAPALRLGVLAVAGLVIYAVALDLQLLDDVGSPPATTRLLIVPALAVGAAGLAMCQWWQRQRAFQTPTWGSALAQLFTSLGAIVVLEEWLRPQFSSTVWMAVGSALAVGMLVLGLGTRSWATAAAGQVPLLTALGAFAGRMFWNLPSVSTLGAGERWAALAPVAASVVSAVALRRFARPAAAGGPEASLWRGAQLFYESFAVFLFAVWTMRFAPPEARLLLLALGGGGLLVLGVERQGRRWLTQGLTLLGFGLIVYGLSSLEGAPVRLSLWNLCGLLILGAAGEYLHRRQAAGAAPFVPTQVRSFLAAAAGLGVWRWLTDVLSAQVGNGWTLAMGWSFLAAGLFAAGLGLRERVYRWLGLGILGFTLGRLAFVEFWNADTLHRIFGLLAFSAVLLGLGFVYNRYGSKMKRWLGPEDHV